MIFLSSLNNRNRVWRTSRPYVFLGVIVNVWIFFSLASYAQSKTILVIGDSLTAGFGLVQSNSFPAQMERSLRQSGINVRIINAGVSGDTSAGGRSRLAWALSENPDAVILELGANDGLRGLDPKQTEANLDAMIRKIRKHKIPVLLAGMLAPPNLGPKYTSEFKNLYVRLAIKHKILFYPFFLEGVASVPELNQVDGIHPNAKGIAEIVRRMRHLVLQLIGQIN